MQQVNDCGQGLQWPSPGSRLKTLSAWYGRYATLPNALDDAAFAEEAARCTQIAQLPGVTEVQDLLHKL